MLLSATLKTLPQCTESQHFDFHTIHATRSIPCNFEVDLRSCTDLPIRHFAVARLSLIQLEIQRPLGAREMAIPLCVQCGTRQNPCRCKIVGPTLGVVTFLVTAVVEWPLGAALYCFRKQKARRLLHHPNRVVYPRVSSAIPF